MNKNTFTTEKLGKGEMNVYDFGTLKLHAYKTNDFIDDEVFIVEKNGSVAEVQVLDTPDPAMGEAAARIVASSPAWKAGTIDGEPVRVRYTLPVRCGKTDPQTTGRQASAGHSRSIDQKALVFIDDKEVKQDTLKTMNPDLIESISVYKVSSAVVRYGERGKNGVILIKMKQ